MGTDWKSWHHPHYLGEQPTQCGLEYSFRPFTGSEPEPAVPEAALQELMYVEQDDGAPGAPRRLYRRMEDEVRAANTLWAEARYIAQVTDALRRAWPTLQEYRRAKAALDATYAALDDTEDSKWRSALLRLVDARRNATAAAEQVDWHGKEIDALDEGLPERVLERTPPTYMIAENLGYDITGWEPTCGASVTSALTQEIRAQDGRIREVYRLAGEKAPL